jgi:hypothetical protein
MSCIYHIQHYAPGCEDCEYELNQIYARLFDPVVTSESNVATSRQYFTVEPAAPPLAPAWATARWPDHPCAVARLLTETLDVEK